MRKLRLTIGQKITILIALMGSLAVLAFTFLSYTLSQNWVEERYAESFGVMASSKAKQIEDFFSEIDRHMSYMREKKQIKDFIRARYDSAYYFALNKDSLNSLFSIGLDDVLNPIRNHYNFKNLYIRDASNGHLVYKSNSEEGKHNLGQPYPEFEELVAKEFKQGEIRKSNLHVVDSVTTIYFAVAISDSLQVLGHVIAEYGLERIYEIIEDKQGLGKSGEINLGCRVGESDRIVFINKQWSDGPKTPLSQSVMMGDAKEHAMQKAVRGDLGKMGDFDDANTKLQDNTETVAYWKHLPFVGWGLVVKIDKAEINTQLSDSIFKFLVLGAIIIALSIVVSLIFSWYLTAPIRSLKSSMDILAQGELPLKVDVESEDEIGDMANAVDNLVQGLKQTALFAKKIGEQDFDAAYTPLGQNDILGNALLTMRDSIRIADEKDKERNWIVAGIAEIGQNLKIHNNLEDLGNDVVSFITNKINGVQGGFYIITDENPPMIKMIASYGYKKKKYLKASFRFAEGLVGQAAVEKDTILRTEIPDDYVTLTSGLLGEQKPKCLLIVPLMTNETVYGLVEVAGFDRFTESQIQFVEQVSEFIARTIFNIKVNDRTIYLLKESRKMSSDLQAQQEVLRQNAEEMQATQEELRRANNRLEEQILEVNRTNKRIQLLLENASEIVTIYEKDNRIRYISPSVESILGYNSSELIGRDEINFVHPSDRKVFLGMFERLLDEPERAITIQYEYRKSDGSWVTLEATGTNLLSDSAVSGIVVNSRDITERIRAEKIEKMRSQMQSLSENSPDLITRISTEHIIFYINPVINQLTGLSQDMLLNRRVEETGLSDNVKEKWMDLIAVVQKEHTKVTTEIEFPTLEGSRIMNVNAIPEFDEMNEIASVLLVSHDITEMKKAEGEIKYQNRKITESINYAQRIQTSILPDTAVVRQLFKDSFVLYKPKDVVSGDFPWVLQMGDNIYVAVADCTGHGVPGALMSLIGHFLLNDIVKTQRIVETNLILDSLHNAVTMSLRQDELNGSKDGMDIALCRINHKTKELEFSGAHRPLLYYSKGVMDQVTGDKFPIGGGEYRTRKNFSSNLYHYEEGDEVYLFSDGLPDQFGGVENKKFSIRRLKELITDYSHENMVEMSQILDSQYIDWKGANAQTDDILIIGIKL